MKAKWIVISLLLVVAASGIALGSYLYVHSLQEAELRNNLITNCEKNGNPLREVLQHRIRREIKQSENTQLLKQFFPNVPPEAVERLIARSIRELRREELEIKPVDCVEQYSK